jgi:hypothetical protein
MASQPTGYRSSGRETIPSRYAWLPKAVMALDGNPKAFADEDSAIVELGVGKNMVRAIRFWVQAAGIAASAKDGYELTTFGKELLSGGGYDPFLEDIRTLWLIHWNLSTDTTNPLFAWDYRRMNHCGVHGARGQRWSCASIRRKADSFRADLHPDLKAGFVPVRKDLATATRASARATLEKPNRRSVGETELHPPFSMSDLDGENLRRDVRLEIRDSAEQRQTSHQFNISSPFARGRVEHQLSNRLLI